MRHYKVFFCRLRAGDFRLLIHLEDWSEAARFIRLVMAAGLCAEVFQRVPRRLFVLLHATLVVLSFFIAIDLHRGYSFKSAGTLVLQGCSLGVKFHRFSHRHVWLSLLNQIHHPDTGLHRG